jgi:dTDP-4-amino-4,6-dideoxygalactose transaminase
MMVRALGNYGSLSKYIHDVKGINSRMDELQAGFLDVKLKYLDEENERRKRIAMYYHYNIDNEKIIKPTKGIISSVWHLFVIRTDKRNELQSYLRKNEVETLIHYPIPPHKQLAYKEWNDYNFPITEKISREVLSLPISPVMSQSEIETIVELINKW